jgi:hypothetical protein
VTARWSPGAAGLYKAAQLVACPAHTAMVAAGVDPAGVAAAVGASGPEGQSPTAITRGVTFERSLTRGGAARLVRTLRAAAGWPDTPVRVLDLDLEHPMPADAAAAGAVLAARQARVAHAVLARSAGQKAPDVILQADLVLRLGGRAWPVRPDALLSRPGDSGYEVAEIKAWSDRGPRTDPASLGSALGQIAVGHLALHQSPARGGAPAGPDEGTVVAAAGSTLAPSLRRLPLAREIAAVQRLGPALEAAAAGVAAVPGGTGPAALLALGTRLTGSCQARCPVYAACRAAARADGSPAALGDRVAAELDGLNVPTAADVVLSGGPAPDGYEALAAVGAAWRTAVRR